MVLTGPERRSSALPALPQTGWTSGCRPSTKPTATSNRSSQSSKVRSVLQPHVQLHVFNAAACRASLSLLCFFKVACLEKERWLNQAAMEDLKLPVISQTPLPLRVRHA